MKAFSYLTGLGALAFIVACTIGWFMNIFHLVTQYDTMSLMELALRIVGIFVAFLGAGMAFFA